MKQVKLREFQRGICLILKEKESIQVIKDDQVIGVWVPTAVRHTSASQKLLNPVEISKSLSDMHQQANNQELRGMKTTYSEVIDGNPFIHKCQKCKKPAEYEGFHWEDGEEFQVKLCAMCSNTLRIQRKTKI